MKKLLALVLAMVMTLGLATVGTNAAEFADQSDISYDEAVNVLSTVGVLGGEGDNKFNPKGELTRAAGAKIIAYLDLGEATAEAMPATQVFDDVPSTFWGAKYIAYCANVGYIGGVGNNKFDPDAPLSGYAFGKMLLCVLGYDAELEGFGGSNWQLNVAKLMGSNDINKSVDKIGSAVLTREEAAQYALNALKADTVEYDTKGTTVSVGGTAAVTVGASKAKSVADSTNVASHRAINNEPASGALVTTVQLGEKLYKGDLVRTVTSDDMNTPADRWTWKTNVEVGYYEHAADFTYVSGKSQTLAKLLDDKLGSKYDWTSDTSHGTAAGIGTIASRNGAAYTTVAADTGLLAGDIVNVYMDSNVAFQIDTVTITRYSVNKVTGAVATRTQSGVDQVRVPGVVASWTDAEDVHGYSGLEKDDYVYWYRDNGGTGAWYLAKATKVEGQLTTIKTSSTPNKYSIGGTDYTVNGNVGAITGLTTAAKYNTNFAYYLDNNNFIVAAKQLEEANRNYVIINALNYAAAGSLSASSRVEARIVKMDGTTEVVKVASIDNGTTYFTGTLAGGAATTTYTATGSPYAANTDQYLVGTTSTTPTINANLTPSTTGTPTYVSGVVAVRANTTATTPSSNTPATAGGGATNLLWTYKINSDGDYEFTTAGKADGTDVTTGNNNQSTTGSYKTGTGRLDTIAVNDSTKFIVVNNPGASSLKYTVYDGKNSVPNFTLTGAQNLKFTYAMENSVATAVFVYDYETRTDTGAKIVILRDGAISTGEAKDSDGASYTYYTYPALVDGAVTIIRATGADMRIGEYSPSYNKNGLLISTGTNAATPSTSGVIGAAGAINMQTANVASNATLTALGYQAVAYLGYNLEGSTLSVGRAYGDDDVYTGGSFNCPSTATVVFVDPDDNFTVGTAADLTKDDNDQIFVILTGNAEVDNTVKTLFVVQRDPDNKDLLSAPLIANAGAGNATRFAALSGSMTLTSTQVGTLTSDVAVTVYDAQNAGDIAASPQTYTGTLPAGVTIDIATKGLCKIEAVGTATSTTGAIAGWTAATNATTFGGGLGSLAVNGTGARLTTAGAGNVTYVIRVTAEDSSVAYYAISAIQ